jgi:hypothetical protein
MHGVDTRSSPRAPTRRGAARRDEAALYSSALRLYSRSEASVARDGDPLAGSRVTTPRALGMSDAFTQRTPAFDARGARVPPAIRSTGDGIHQLMRSRQ